MKPIFVFLLAGLLAVICPSHAADSKPLFKFKNTPTGDVLAFYKAVSGLELVVDPKAKAVSSPINLETTSPVTKEEALKLIEKALLTQAGIVITRLDDKRASVTFNGGVPGTR